MGIDIRKIHAWIAGAARYKIERDRDGVRFWRDCVLIAFARDDLDGRLPIESQARNDALRELLSLAERSQTAEEWAMAYRRALELHAVGRDGTGLTYCKMCGAVTASGSPEHRESCLMRVPPSGMQL